MFLGRWGHGMFCSAAQRVRPASVCCVPVRPAGLQFAVPARPEWCVHRACWCVCKPSERSFSPVLLGVLAAAARALLLLVAFAISQCTIVMHSQPVLWL